MSIVPNQIHHRAAKIITSPQNFTVILQNALKLTNKIEPVLSTQYLMNYLLWHEVQLVSTVTD